MAIVDERGNLFGRLNLIDAMAIVVILALVVAGAAFVTQSSGQASGTAATSVETTITVQSAVPPYVLDAIETGEVTGGDVSTVDDVEVLGTVELAEPDAAGISTYHRVALTLSVDARREDGDLTFRGDELYVGREVDLDLGRTAIEGVIVDAAT